MDHPDFLNSIMKTEIAYAALSANIAEEPKLIRVTDDLIPQRAAYNYLYICKDCSHRNAAEIVTRELKTREHLGMTHTRVTFDPQNPHWQQIPELAQMEHICELIMLLPLSLTTDLYFDESCFLYTEAYYDLVYALEFEFYKERGIDYAHRQSLLKLENYATAKNIDLLFYLLKGHAVGDCELFYDKGNVKFDDFKVLSNYRLKGIGTRLLHYAIYKARQAGAEQLYLVTDKADSVKALYEKNGFSIADEYHVFIKKHRPPGCA